MAESLEDENYVHKISEYDVDRFISPLCDDTLEELLRGPDGKFKANEQAASLKGKLRSDCRDFKRLALPYEHLMLQVVNLVEDVISKNVTFEVGQRLAKDVQTTFSKFKCKDDSYEKSKTRARVLNKRCTLCINKYKSYIEKVNTLGLRSTTEDLVLCHYLSISVLPVLDFYLDIVTSYEKLIETYHTSIEFFKSEGDCEDDQSRLPSDTILEKEKISANSSKSKICNSDKKSKNKFFSFTPVILGIGTFLIAAFIVHKILKSKM